MVDGHAALDREGAYGPRRREIERRQEEVERLVVCAIGVLELIVSTAATATIVVGHVEQLVSE